MRRHAEQAAKSVVPVLSAEFGLAQGPSQPDTGDAGVAAQSGDLSHALAHERGTVDGALGGDHDPGGPNPFRQPGIAGKKPNPGFKPRLEETTQTKTKPAGLPVTGFLRRILPQVPMRHLGESGQASLGVFKIFWPESLLRPVKARGQKILN